MSRPLGWLNQKYDSLSLVQRNKLIGAVSSVIFAGVLPVIGLWILLFFTVHAYYLEILLGVILVNLVARYGNRAFKSIMDRDKRLKKAKREKIEVKHASMLHYVAPSAFTLRYSALNKQELTEMMYADDAQHWIVAARLFFNPFSERTDKPPNLFVRTCVSVVPYVWILGWFLAIFLVFGPPIATLTSFTAVLWVIMTVWTVTWTVYILWLWPRDRFILTEYTYAETLRRIPWQVERESPGRTDYLTSVPRSTTWLGKILGYSHFELQSWHDPEPIVYRRFVKDPERIQVLLTHFKEQNKTKEPPIVKMMPHRTKS